MWNMLRLALDLTVRNTASTKMLAFERKIWHEWDSILLRLECCHFDRKIWPEWDSNPRTHSCMRSLKGEFLESGALDRSAILPWVYRTCFILSSITPSCNVKSVCLASLLTLRTPASTKMMLFERKIWQELDSNPRTHSCTRSLKGEFLESGALDRSAILPWVYRTCFILSSITPSCNVKSASSSSWFDSQKYCLDQNVGFLNAKFDVSGIRYCFD